MPDEAPEHPAPRRKRSARFDNLGEKDEAETRSMKRALRPHAWASVEAGTESECESSSLLFDRTRRGFQRLVGNLKTENSSSLSMYLSVIGLLPLVRQRRRHHQAVEKLVRTPRQEIH